MDGGQDVEGLEQVTAGNIAALQLTFLFPNVALDINLGELVVSVSSDTTLTFLNDCHIKSIFSAICNCDSNHICTAPYTCVCPVGWTGDDCMTGWYILSVIHVRLKAQGIQKKIFSNDSCHLQT